MNFKKFHHVLSELEAFLDYFEESNLANVRKRYDRLKRELEMQKAYNATTVGLVGGKNIGNAHKTLRLRAAEKDISQLPEELRRPPAIWLTGKPKTRFDDGFPARSTRSAEREHRYNLEAIIDAWTSIQALEDVQQREASSEAFLDYYRNSSAEDFSRKIYFFIHDLEEPDFEPFDEETRDEPTYEELMRSVRLVSEQPNYGVESQEEKTGSLQGQ